ncbi:PREDICTED: uncharacterized protein LOC105556583 [Vollenhovia emeryi]|uniref:uncharacterized protein LOC105556583 n=1 Tax=Vollenhovia emeryi TaxID=411798 RepID=UPI0005F52FA1|nr:PREDICTED: uncharacterized protein LOC105556583 [Vollenhovia emeryi]
MAFGLSQWFISFAIFLIVLTVITWSAVHLGRKHQNSTGIALRSSDIDDYSTEWKNKSLHSAISTLQIIETTADTFANDQGSEIPDSAQFFEILRTFYSTKDSAINSTNFNIVTTTFTPSVVTNSSTWNDDTVTTLSNISDKTFVLDDRRNVSRNFTILPDYISQTANRISTLAHDVKLFNVDKSDLNQSGRTELSGFSRDAGNGTSNAFVAFPFTQAFLFDARQSDTTERAKTVRAI